MNIRDVALISIAVLGVLIFLALAFRAVFIGTALWPFYQKRIMTRAQQTLYFRIAKALPDHLVLTKVHLESFLGVKNGYRASAWNHRISRLSTDFLVCTLDARIVVAIDIDGETPETPQRRSENKRKNLALESAGIKLVRWHVRSLPTDGAIREMLIRQVRHVGPQHEPQSAEAPMHPAPSTGKPSYVPLSRRSASVLD